MLHKRRSLIISSIAIIIFAIPATYAYLHRQDLTDWWQLRHYQVPSPVAALASDTTMSDKARKIFYVNHPAIQDKSSFYSSCNDNEKTPVLGCFVSSEGIYVLQVQESRLNGVEQVTAAHEMLHAAYDRLGGSEKTHINQLLTQTYQNLHDDRLNQKIELYRQNKADVVNELHSILGTEITSLPPELETYYQRYFANRKKIAEYFNQYQSVLTDARTKVEQYTKTLTDLEAQIKSNNDKLDAQSAVLDGERKQLDSLRTSDVNAYNASINAFNAKVNRYNALIGNTRKLIADYKSTLAARNTAADQAQELGKALDNRISTRESL